MLRARNPLSFTAAQTSLAFIVFGAVVAVLQFRASGLLAKFATRSRRRRLASRSWERASLLC